MISEVFVFKTNVGVSHISASLCVRVTLEAGQTGILSKEIVFNTTALLTCNISPSIVGGTVE